MFDRFALPLSPRPNGSLWIRLGSSPAVAGLTLLGIWFFGGVATNDYKLSMTLTALWLVTLGLACLVFSWRRRLWLPVLGTFLVTSGVAGGYIAYTTFVGKTVNEPVPIARPASEVAPGARVNIELARGTFRGIAHATSGLAAIVRLRSGERVLELLSLDTHPGPDLRVYLVAGRLPRGSDPGDHKDLGGLKGNKGTQQYAIPARLDTRRYSTVVIWCRAFSVAFGVAELELL